MAEVLNKREMLRRLANLGDKLRMKPEVFTKRGDEEHMPTTQIRLNSLGKVLSIVSGVMMQYPDGAPLEGDLKEYMSQYDRLIKECTKPYSEE